MTESDQVDRIDQVICATLDISPHSQATSRIQSRRNSNESTRSYWSSGRKYRAPPPPQNSTSYHNGSHRSSLNKISIKEKLKLSWSKESTRRQCYVWTALGLFLLSLIILVVIIVGRFLKIPDPETPTTTEFPSPIRPIRPIRPIKYRKKNPVMLILGGENIESGEKPRKKVDVLTSEGICNFPYGYPPSLPSARIGHSVAVSRKNGQVMLCGGYDPANFRKSYGLSIGGQKQTADWSLNSNITWTTMPRLPIGISHGTMAIVNNAVIVIGGYHDSLKNRRNVDTIQILKSRSSNWKISKSKYPLRVWGHCSVVSSTDGKIFSTGGISDGEDSQNNLRSVYVTDGTSLRSTKLKSRMKVGRATHACLATPFKKYGEEFALVVAGGITSTSHLETPTASVEVFLSSRDKWISMDDMLQPRSWYPSLVITNKRLACVGGKGTSNKNYITAEWYLHKKDKWKQIKAISSTTISRYNARIVVVPIKTDHNFNICV